MSEQMFKAWDNKNKRWIKDFAIKPNGDLFRIIYSDLTGNVLTVDIKDATLCRSTGLKDKNNIDFIFEGDIISCEGIIKGNIYEQKTKKNDFVIPRITSKDWLSAYQKALELGCINT